MDAASDYTEYIFTFDVVHKDRPEYKESVRVEQFPMIAIKADQNYDYGHDKDKRGYVIVNKNATLGGSRWDGVYGNMQSGENNNPNRYIISVTSLTEEAGNKYIIGDPRTRVVNNPTNINKDDNNKALQYYYPTDGSAATQNMISPEFMVASSYGRCTITDLSKEEAIRRCATYQEDGYPAGRWRIPTQAEISYIVQLSGWDIIPSLFSDNMNYWSAQSTIQVNGQNVTSTSGANGLVRCVYDTWYWGTEQMPVNQRATFVYGDKQRSLQ
jgi:hypothetical protein